MISAVLMVVNVIKQGSCPSIRLRIDLGGYLLSELSPVVDFGCECSMWNRSSFQKVKNGIGSSPCWISVLEKSIDRRKRRGGVPVFSRPSSSPISLSDAESPIAAESPARPPDCWFEPICIKPLKNVPVVMTTALARYRTSIVVSTPNTNPSLCKSAEICPCLTSRFGWDSQTHFILNWYAFLSHCARGAQTAGPFFVFNIRNCNPVISVVFPISPPS